MSALRLTALAALLSLQLAQASPARLERMVVSKMRKSDLEGSASGYAYDNRHGDAPVSYVQYTSHTGAAGSLPYDGLAYPVYTSYNTYPVYAYDDYAEPLAPYYPSPYLEPPPAVHQPVSYPSPAEYEELHQRRGDEEAFEEAGGAEHQDEDNSVQGERAEKGYGGHHNFDKGENEHHETDHREGDYHDEGGHKGGHEQSQSRYDAHEQSDAGQDGANYGNKAYQKKGVRTSGFHNVYHKDEYKKDTDFYDEDHKGGHYEKYGAHDARHNDEASGHEKGGSHDLGFEQEQRGRSGHSDKGHTLHDQRGHKAAEGEDSYRQEQADYASKAGRHHASQRGYKQGHGYR